MPRLLLLAGLALLMFAWHGTNAACAQVIVPAFQYRYRNLSIPAASADEPIAGHFSSESARKYLDSGATMWANQQKCVSCHTHGVYMLTRPALSAYWGEPSQKLRDFVVTQAEDLERSGMSTGSAPIQMAYLARGLAEWDAQFNATTSPETDAALRHVFELQADDGSIDAPLRWPPLNSDTYHGTIMAAMAVATAPGWRSSLQDEELSARIDELEAYLRETPPKNDHQRTLLLWASTRVESLLGKEQRQKFVNMLWSQQRDDGGWSIRTFATPESLGGGRRAEQLKTEADYLNPSSDGYQTGLAVVVLREAGVAAEDARIQRAVKWLLSNQRESGRWWTRSLNTESRFHFITYSGSAYSALALAKCNAMDRPVLPESK